MTQLVHGALVHYDLPDLAAVLENKITVEQPVNALGAVIQESKEDKVGWDPRSRQSFRAQPADVPAQAAVILSAAGSHSERSRQSF